MFVVHLCCCLVFGFAVIFLRFGGICLCDEVHHWVFFLSSEVYWILLNCVMYTFLFVNVTTMSSMVYSRTESRVYLIFGTRTAFVLISPCVKSIPSWPEWVMRAGWIVSVCVMSVLLWIVPGAGVGKYVRYAVEYIMILGVPMSLEWASKLGPSSALILYKWARCDLFTFPERCPVDYLCPCSHFFDTLCSFVLGGEDAHDPNTLRVCKSLDDSWKHDTYSRFRSLPHCCCSRI